MFSKRLRKRLISVFVLLFAASIVSPDVSAQLTYPEDSTIAEKFAVLHQNNNTILNDFIYDLREINDYKLLSKDPAHNISTINQARLKSYEPDDDLSSKCTYVDEEDFNLSPICLYTLMAQEYEALLAQLPAEKTTAQQKFIDKQASLMPDIMFHSSMYYAEFFNALPVIQELQLIEDELSKVRRSLQYYYSSILRLKTSLPNATSTQCK